MIEFLDHHLESAIKLVHDFDKTKEKKWEAKDYLNELYVQLGHVYNVLYGDPYVNERNRKIDNLGDELSDVLLQLINLADLLNIDMYEMKSFEKEDYQDINGFPILLGQLSEVIMEMSNCRFKKERSGYRTSHDFAKERIFKLFIITYNIAMKYDLDMIKEFGDMVEDANGFLSRFEPKKAEYIDIYDEKERYLGYSEKKKAHELGLFHKVIGCLILSKEKIYFQLKNPKHNGVHEKEYLEITAGGHLMSGETLKGGVREIEEETGLNVLFEDLTFLEKRICDKRIKEDYIIKEFQYFYYLDIHHFSLLNFKNYDKEEIVSFVELKINDVIHLLNGKRKRIKGKKIKEEKEVEMIVTLDDFDPDFLEEGLYHTLLHKIKNKRVNTKKKLKRIKGIHRKANTINRKDFIRNGLCFSVTIDEEQENYIVGLTIDQKEGLLEKVFQNYNVAMKYFERLISYVENTAGSEIITDCYEEKHGK
ncbi:MAG: NUDIX domain-containing protein [Bacilli bacterium]|nr:NUDIX domain-containing protein [Bacilli bacterium]